MTIVLLLAPFSLMIAATALAAFWWTIRSGQYEDPKGDAARILDDHLREGPGDGA
jgi:cbb3-type cytochrome oxidase maturation protein